MARSGVRCLLAMVLLVAEVDKLSQRPRGKSGRQLAGHARSAGWWNLPGTGRGWNPSMTKLPSGRVRHVRARRGGGARRGRFCGIRSLQIISVAALIICGEGGPGLVGGRLTVRLAP